MTTPRAPIAFITDERISREASGVVTEKVRFLRKYFQIDILRGEDTTEKQLIQKAQEGHYSVIIAPHTKYSAWIQLENALGINRTEGPAFVGYFCEPMPFRDLLEPPGHSRRMFFDFAHLTSQELKCLLSSLIEDSRRSGLKPLLDPNTLLYCESWYGGLGQGNRTDQVMNIQELSQDCWRKRSGAIRILLSALWSLIYEEGPGKKEASLAMTPDTKPRAYFQLGADSNCLALRLFFHAAREWSPVEAIQRFWPDPASPTRAAQLLLKFSDFIRVHSFTETSDVEIVAGLFNSAPSEHRPDEAHTLWIEPLAKKLLVEYPYEAPSPQHPELRALPPLAAQTMTPRIIQNNSQDNNVIQIKELKEQIRELRSGGVGTAKSLPIPDAESLLEAFQQRYSEANYEIRQIELQIADIVNRGASPQQIHILRLKMEAIANRQRAWIKKLTETIENHKGTVRSPKGDR